MGWGLGTGNNIYFINPVTYIWEIFCSKGVKVVGEFRVLQNEAVREFKRHLILFE
jgi:hypothetical protein